MVKQHFLDEDAPLILNIPQPKTPQANSILWHFDKKGVYSVKSSCQIAMKIKHHDTPGCSKDNPGYWCSLWTIDLPTKIKYFMWRASKNLLLTADNLWKIKIVQNTICQVCRK